jgi:sugar/nucleoside kinase (ribokinase family)
MKNIEELLPPAEETKPTTAAVLYHSEEDGLNKITFDIGNDTLLTIQEGKTPGKNSGYITTVSGRSEPTEQTDLDAKEIAKHANGITDIRISQKLTQLPQQNEKKSLMTGMRLLFPKEKTK